MMATPAAGNLRGARLIGRGFTSDVYAWGEGRVLPVPAACELVEVEGRRGIVFERVEGPSLLRHTQARPWTLFSAVRQLAELPSQREWIAGGIDAASDLSPAQKEAARAAWPTCRTGRRYATAISTRRTSSSRGAGR
jgi:hypothetical protein